jgi:hypothetical protein
MAKKQKREPDRVFCPYTDAGAIALKAIITVYDELYPTSPAPSSGSSRSQLKLGE